MSTYEWRNAGDRGVAEATEMGRRMVDEHPLPSVLTVFGLGVGVGLLLAAAIPGSRRREEETMAHRISRQVLQGLEGLGHMLPEAVSRQLRR